MTAVIASYICKPRVLLAAVLCTSAWTTSSCKQSSKSSSKADSGAVLAGQVGEEHMSKELLAMRDRFLGITNRADLAVFLEDAAADLAKNPNGPADKRFYEAHLVILRPFRAAIFRITDLLTNYATTHSLLLTIQQQTSSTIATYFPTGQWTAVLDYVTQPDPDSVPLGSIEAVQDELETALGQALANSIEVINSLKISDAAPIVWDGRFLYGPASYRDNHDRFVKIGVAEKHQILGSFEHRLMQLRLGLAYNLNSLLPATAEVGKLIGLDGFFDVNSIQGSPMQSRVEILKKPDYADFLTLRAASTLHPNLGNGKALIDAAYTNLKNATAHKDDQFKAVVDRGNALGDSNDDWWGLNPAAVLAHKRVIQASINEATALVSGPAAITSLITGETLQTNLPAFFSNPPADLKAFMPVQFVAENQVTVNNHTIRNYYYGSPTAWNPAPYSGIIPGVQGPADVKTAARILSESRAGSFLLTALEPFVN